MSDQILVPTDGSPESERALEIALPLAKACDCTITFIWCWEGLEALEGVVDAELVDTITQREVSDRKELLQQLGRKACEPSGVAWLTLAPTGKPAAEVVAASEDADVRFIVMATHGRSGFKRWRLGSVADRVVRSASKPTVLVSPSEDEQPLGSIEKIVVPLDGSELSEGALPVAVEIARQCGASLQLLRAVTALVPITPLALNVAYDDANRAAAAAADAYLARAGEQAEGVPVTTSVVRGHTSSAIIDAAADADMVIMASHGRGGFMRFALGSVADAVTRGSAKPVMVVPHVEE